jgi:putative ABC transport system permease protein
MVLGSTTRFIEGATFSMAFNNAALTFIVADVRDVVPGLAAGRGWVVVPRDGLEAALGDGAPPISMVLVRSPSQADAVARAIRETAPAVSVETRAEAMSRLRQTPLAAAITNGFGLASLLAAAFAALALVIGLALTAPQRVRDSARLRTMGASGYQVLGLAAVEQLPPVVVALATGGAFGIVMGWLILPSIDLRAVTGGPRTVEIVTDPGRTAALLAGVLGILLLGVLGAVLADSRRHLGRAMRIGDEVW